MKKRTQISYVSWKFTFLSVVNENEGVRHSVTLQSIQTHDNGLAIVRTQHTDTCKIKRWRRDMSCLNIVRYSFCIEFNSLIRTSWIQYKGMFTYVHECTHIHSLIHAEEKSAWLENRLYTSITRIHATTPSVFSTVFYPYVSVYGMLFSTLTMVNACLYVCVRLCWGITNE